MLETDVLHAATAAILEEKIRSRRARVGIVGLGYVGLPLAVEFARAGFTVTGIDISEEKIRRVRDLGKTEAEAVELVGAIDQERATFVKKYFGKEWPSRHLYHLMINSAVGDDVVVRTILDEMTALNGTRRA